ncbi:RHS repeat-associated core domain-containing protein, partial [Streptomyces sp. NPDC089799]|uniref:RHS repeat domain-containing protein n=1 Tax=Streptomyces sp. NPDC089799 TaxID=3155066 RepID=UPI003422327B
TAETLKTGDTTGLPKRFAYDDAGRLTRACTDITDSESCLPGTEGERYTYDKAGNRLTSTSGTSTTTHTYDAADQLTKSTTGTTVTDLTYDADGNQTTDGSGTYAYDALGRVKSAAIGDDAFTFTYDADGNRTSVEKNAELQRTSQWDVNGNIPRLATERNGTGVFLADYHYGPQGEPQALDTRNATYWFLRDRQNSVTSVLDQAGTQTHRYTYGTWGTTEGTAGGGTEQTSPFGFNGAPKDSVLSGRVQLPARSYDTASGRFTTQDPRPDTAIPANSSTYAYANNDPVNQADPTGACPICVSIGVGAVIGGVVEGGIYAWQHRNGGFTLGGLAKAAGKGAVVGGIAGAFMPGAGNLAARSLGLAGGRALATSAAVNTAVGAGYSYATNAAQCQPTEVSDLLLGGAGGAASSLVGPAFSALRKLRGKPPVTNPMPKAGNVTPKAWVTPRKVYRGDSRDPSVVFAQGFQVQASDEPFDLLRYGWYNEGSAGVVGTTKHPSLAAMFPQKAKGTTWVYEIDSPGTGIDVNKALGLGYVFRAEKEILFAAGIDGSRIIRAIRYSWGMPTGQVMENPGYLPQ